MDGFEKMIDISKEEIWKTCFHIEFMYVRGVIKKVVDGLYKIKTP